MSLYESEEPFVPTPSAPTPPRSWQAMLLTWAELMATLAAIVGENAPALDAEGLAAVIDRLHVLTWTWMWSLPPCSMARKAAFEFGRAAMLIGRWRSCISEVHFRPDDGFPVCLGYMVGKDDGRTTLQVSDENARALPEAQAIGDHADEALRIVARQIVDARDEARAQPSTIPLHEAVYSASVYNAHNAGINFLGSSDGKRGAYMILRHHFSRMRGQEIEVTDALLQRFADTAIASLPEGAWLATTQDVDRFARLAMDTK